LSRQQPHVCGTSPELQRSKRTVKYTAVSATATWQIDPCAEAFPAMLVDEFEALKASISRNGLQDPLLLWNGRIMDGRHRLKACQALGITPHVVELAGPYEAAKSAAFASNINRRHLGIGQRALLAAQLASHKRGQTKSAKQDAPALTQEEAARLFAISRDAVQKACRLLTLAETSILNQVREGTMSLHEANVTSTTGRAGLVAQTTIEERKALRVAAAVKERLGEASRAQRLNKQAAISEKNQALPTGAKYSVILADPPWDYGMPNDRAPSRVIPQEKYPTMAVDAICAMDVAALTADDAMLFLWCPASLLPDGLRVMQAWGFEYSSNWVWHKTAGKLTCGGGTATIHHEHLLVGKRGTGLTIAGKKLRQSSVLGAPVTQHSAKPVEAHKRIEALYPKLNRVELFSRSARDGWTAWGNQSGSGGA
jgi:N6-adenosine-specific RNA methylase IME4